MPVVQRGWGALFVIDSVCKLLLVGGVGAAKSSDDNDDADTLCVYDDDNDNENF